MNKKTKAKFNNLNRHKPKRGEIMRITSEMLSAVGKPCSEGIAWFEAQEDKTPKRLLKAAGKDEKKLEWCNWGIAHLLSKDDRVRYAIYSARKVLHIYEEKYPGDDRPKRAIDAAEKYLNEPTEKNKRAAAYAAAGAADAARAADAADAAAGAAWAAWAARAARAAADAAYAAADAAYAAAYAAAGAADAARAAADAADAAAGAAWAAWAARAARAAADAADAADAAADAAYAAYAAADAEMKIDIISYGIKLLEGENKGKLTS